MILVHVGPPIMDPIERGFLKGVVTLVHGGSYFIVPMATTEGNS